MNWQSRSKQPETDRRSLRELLASCEGSIEHSFAPEPFGIKQSPKAHPQVPVIFSSPVRVPWPVWPGRGATLQVRRLASGTMKDVTTLLLSVDHSGQPEQQGDNRGNRQILNSIRSCRQTEQRSESLRRSQVRFAKHSVCDRQPCPEVIAKSDHAGENVRRNARDPRQSDSLRSGFRRNRGDLRPFLAYLLENEAEFLCTSDCVAENAGWMREKAKAT